MNLSDYFAWAGARSIDQAGTDTLDFKTKGHPEMVFEAVSSTSLQLKVSWIGGGGSVSANTRCIVKRSTGTEEILDPNTACTALVAGDRIIVPNEGAKSIRLTATAGSGTIASLQNPSTFATIVYLLAKLLDGGLSATITQPDAIVGPADPVIDSYTHKAINLTTGANQVLVSSAANKQIWVYGYGFLCGDADGQTVSLQDEDDVALTGIMEFKQYGGIARNPSGNFAMPLFKLGTDKDLEVDITGGDVDGDLQYAIVSV